MGLASALWCIIRKSKIAWLGRKVDPNKVTTLSNEFFHGVSMCFAVRSVHAWQMKFPRHLKKDAIFER